MLNLCTVVWEKSGRFRGDDERFRDVGLPSLMQPDNIPAAAKLGLIGSYNFFATPYARDVISQSKAYHRLEQIVPVTWYPLQKSTDKTEVIRTIGEVTSSLLYQMKLSAQKGSYMFHFNADYVIGNKSILNVAQLCAEGKYAAILRGVPRIAPSAFDEIKLRLQAGEIISNRKLVSIHMRHRGEKSKAEETAPGSNKWLRSTEAGIVIPNIILRPDEKIIEFWSTNCTPNFGWDHVLPIWMIDHGYSWCYIDHSDVFFAGDIALAWLGFSKEWHFDDLKRAVAFFRKHCQEHPITWQGET